LTAEQKNSSNWGSKSFIDIDHIPTGVEFRAEFSRRSDTLYASPQLLNYSLKVVERKSQFNLTSPEGYPKMINYRLEQGDYEVT
jgi:hypothetical protein